MKQQRLKTSRGVAKRILNLATLNFAITACDLMKVYNFTYRHSLRYIKWMQEENLLYLRYRKNNRNYYSPVRRKK